MMIEIYVTQHCTPRRYRFVFLLKFTNLAIEVQQISHLLELDDFTLALCSFGLTATILVYMLFQVILRLFEASGEPNELLGKIAQLTSNLIFLTLVFWTAS